MQENYQPCNVRRIKTVQNSYEVLKPIHLPASVDGEQIVWPEVEINPQVRINEVAVRNGMLYVLRNSSFMLWNGIGRDKYSSDKIRSLIQSSSLLFVADGLTASRLEREIEELLRKREEAKRRYFEWRVH